MRSDEMLLKAKEQQTKVTQIIERFSEWAEWEPSEEQVAYEEEHEEWLVDENEICFDIYELSSKVFELLETYIADESTGVHQAKRDFKDCISTIRNIRENVNEIVDDKEQCLLPLDCLEKIVREYI